MQLLGFVAEDDFEEAIEESIHVVAVDSGTWPTDGGGVATCRELVLDYVQHVRWSVLSEIGNDFKQVRSPVSISTLVISPQTLLSCSWTVAPPRVCSITDWLLAARDVGGDIFINSGRICVERAVVLQHKLYMVECQHKQSLQNICWHLSVGQSWVRQSQDT